VQSGESDFEFLQRLADKSGFNFRVSNSNLYFVNPNILIKERTVIGVPTFTLNKDLTHFDTVGKFQMKAGENIPGRVKARREVYGLDANGNLVRAAGGDGRVTRIDTTEVASSYGEAKRLVTGLNLYEQNWTLAEATVMGDTRIEPGRLVYLAGNALPDQNEGYWMVEEVIHRVQSALVDPTKDIFTSEMKLSRNSQNTVAIKDQHLLLDSKNVACILDHSGNWRSSIVTAVIGENA
jgi:phage protein D